MPAAPRTTWPCRLLPDHAAGLAQTARMSGSGNGLPNRGNDLLALESAGGWRAVYIDDMQKVLGTYDPAQ